MGNKKHFTIVESSQFSQKILVNDSEKEIGSLSWTFPFNSGMYKGADAYAFLQLNDVGNSFRVFKDGKSVGYLHIHAYRNLAQVNLLEEGPYQFSTEGIFNGNWMLKQGLKSVEREGKKLFSLYLDEREEELVMACGLFIAAKIKSDLSLLALGGLLFLILIFVLW